MTLNDQVAVVTGAARGIGRASADRLLAAGCRVVLNTRAETAETAASFAALEAAYPGRTAVVYGSVADSAAVKAIGQLVFSRYKRLDVLVNNAGILRDGLIGMIPDAEVDEVMATNLTGLLKMTQMAARIMVRQNAGSIVNLSSIIGRRGNPGQFVYGASKAAVIGATRAAAKELAPRGVRVNAVAPGLIDTPMITAIPAPSRKRLEDGIGLGRIGTPEDVADVVLFLASGLSSYVTGQVIGADGGLVL